MNPLGTRARAEELAALLDGAVAGPGSLTAPQAGLAARLIALAPTLEAIAAPRPEFRDALRQRLVAVATVQGPYAEPVERPRALEAAVSWSQTRKAQRRIGVTAGAMASVVAVAGVGVAATRSLPGQPFYGVKKLGEAVQLDLASGDTAKGTKHLEFAATRLREVKALASDQGSLSLGAPGRPTAAGVAFGGSTDSRIASALRDFDSETHAGTALLKKVYDTTGKPAPLRILTRFTAEQTSRLTALLPVLPPAVQPQAQSSLALVTKTQTDATDLLALGTCNGSCYPGNAGPQVPAVPEPTPGATATPTDSAPPAPQDDNGVPGCTCVSPSPAPSPDDTPQPAPTPSDAPAPSPSETPSPEPTPSDSPTPEPSLLPGVPLPTLPVPLPTLPVPVPTPPVPLPTLPVVLPTLPALPKS